MQVRAKDDEDAAEREDPAEDSEVSRRDERVVGPGLRKGQAMRPASAAR